MRPEFASAIITSVKLTYAFWANLKPTSENAMKDDRTIKPLSQVAIIRSGGERSHVSSYHRAQVDKLEEDEATTSRRTVGELLSAAAIVTTDQNQKASPFVGVEINKRERTITFRSNVNIGASPEDLTPEGTEWINVRANTSLEHLLDRFGERLLFYVSHRKEQHVSVFFWDVYDTEDRSVRVLVKKEH